MKNGKASGLIWLAVWIAFALWNIFYLCISFNLTSVLLLGLNFFYIYIIVNKKIPTK